MLKTGFPQLDQGFSGFEPGDFVLLIGSQGTGKSFFSYQLILNAIINGKIPTYLWSLANESRDDVWWYLTSIHLKSADKDKIGSFMAGLQPWLNYSVPNALSEASPLYIDNVSITCEDALGFIKDDLGIGNVRFLVVDCLDLIAGQQGQINDVEIVCSISNELWNFAKATNAIVLLICQSRIELRDTIPIFKQSTVLDTAIPIKKIKWDYLFSFHPTVLNGLTTAFYKVQCFDKINEPPKPLSKTLLRFAETYWGLEEVINSAILSV